MPAAGGNVAMENVTNLRESGNGWACYVRFYSCYAPFRPPSPAGLDRGCTPTITAPASPFVSAQNRLP